jgi:hypothetical protein
MTTISDPAVRAGARPCELAFSAIAFALVARREPTAAR